MKVAHKRTKTINVLNLARSAMAPVIKARRNNGKHHLEEHESLMRNSGGIVRIRLRSNSIQTQPRETP